MVQLDQFRDLSIIYLHDLRKYINKFWEVYEAWQIIVISVFLTYLVQWIWTTFAEEGLISRIKKRFFKILRKIPMVRAKIEKEMGSATQMILETFNKNVVEDYLKKLPAKSSSPDEVLLKIETYRKMCDVDWSKGLCSGTVYNGDQTLTDLLAKVYGIFAWANPLHADVFPDVRKMEAEVVQMAVSMFHGDSEACGVMSSGGTESIMLAMKAYRDMARERGIKHPELIAPISAHAAFDKACHYFCIKLVHIPVDNDGKADVKAMYSAITKNTIALVGSAPSFQHGIIDPIKKIAELGRKYSIPVHVDCCLGGFLLPFMDEAGYPIEAFDFRIKGVTSISADTHKYGFAPKGSSIILYSNSKYRQWQYYSNVEWTGGIYASPTFAGSRPGAIIAACWAAMISFGEEGYLQTTKDIISTTRYIFEKLKPLHGIKIYGGKVSVIGIGSDYFNIYDLSSTLAKKGWNLNSLQNPQSIHVCVTLLHTKKGVADTFIGDITEAVEEMLKIENPVKEGTAAIYGMAASVPDKSLINDVCNIFIDSYYSTKFMGLQNGKLQNGTTH